MSSLPHDVSVAPQSMGATGQLGFRHCTPRILDKRWDGVCGERTL